MTSARPGALSDADLDDLQDALVRSRPAGLRDHRRPVGHVVRAEGGELLAGIAGHVEFGWLCIGTFWVHEAHRSRGLGARLLATLERDAVGWDCHDAYVDTFSFQARPFYERHGYRVFGELREFPPGHRKYFLHKTLGAGGGS